MLRILLAGALVLAPAMAGTAVLLLDTPAVPAAASTAPVQAEPYCDGINTRTGVREQIPCP